MALFFGGPVMIEIKERGDMILYHGDLVSHLNFFPVLSCNHQFECRFIIKMLCFFYCILIVCVVVFYVCRLSCFQRLFGSKFQNLKG